MANEPLTGARIPNSSSAPNIPGDLWNAIWDVADNTIPHSFNVTERNNKYAAWVATGAVMRNGLFHYVEGVGLTMYLNGQWTVVPTTYEVKAMQARRTADTLGFPHDAYTAFADNTNWSETDPWNMRGSGAQWLFPWTGGYQINATVWFNNNATGTRGMRVVPGGAYDLGSGSGASVSLASVKSADGGTDTVISGSHILFATAGNTAQLEAYQNSGGTLQVNQVTISAAYLGPNT